MHEDNYYLLSNIFLRHPYFTSRVFIFIQKHEKMKILHISHRNHDILYYMLKNFLDIHTFSLKKLYKKIL